MENNKIKTIRNDVENKLEYNNYNIDDNIKNRKNLGILIFVLVIILVIITTIINSFRYLNFDDYDNYLSENIINKLQYISTEYITGQMIIPYSNLSIQYDSIVSVISTLIIVFIVLFYYNYRDKKLDNDIIEYYYINKCINELEKNNIDKSIYYINKLIDNQEFVYISHTDLEHYNIKLRNMNNEKLKNRLLNILLKYLDIKKYENTHPKNDFLTDIQGYRDDSESKSSAKIIIKAIVDSLDTVLNNHKYIFLGSIFIFVLCPIAISFGFEIILISILGSFFIVEINNRY